MRNIKYTVERIILVDEKIITIGSRDKYIVSTESHEFKVLRYSDGRTVNEKHTYQMISQTCMDANTVYVRTNDIILGIWGAGGGIKLWILRPIFRSR